MTNREAIPPEIESAPPDIPIDVLAPVAPEGRVTPNVPGEDPSRALAGILAVAGNRRLCEDERALITNLARAGWEAAGKIASGEELTAAQRVALERARTLGERALECFVRADHGLVVSIAKRYMYADLDLPELIQAGRIGLIVAARTHDSRRGAFSNHATHWIRNFVRRAVIGAGRAIYLPTHVHEKVVDMALTAQKLSEEHGREPTDQEVADEMGVSKEMVIELRAYDRRPLSIDWRHPDTGMGLGDVLPDTPRADAGPLVEHTALAREVEAAIQGFSPLIQKVLRLRLGLEDGREWPTDDIGQAIGRTDQRVRQILKKRLPELANALHDLPEIRRRLRE